MRLVYHAVLPEPSSANRSLAVGQLLVFDSKYSLRASVAAVSGLPGDCSSRNFWE